MKQSYKCPECDGKGGHTFLMRMPHFDNRPEVYSKSKECPSCKGKGRIECEVRR